MDHQHQWGFHQTFCISTVLTMIWCVVQEDYPHADVVSMMPSSSRHISYQDDRLPLFWQRPPKNVPPWVSSKLVFLFGRDSTPKKSEHICSYNGSQVSPWLTLTVDFSRYDNSATLEAPHLFGNLGLGATKCLKGSHEERGAQQTQDSRGFRIIQRVNVRKLWEMHEEYG